MFWIGGYLDKVCAPLNVVDSVAKHLDVFAQVMQTGIELEDKDKTLEARLEPGYAKKLKQEPLRSPKILFRPRVTLQGRDLGKSG